MIKKIVNLRFNSDLLELFIIFGFTFMIITIYVPKAIWEEEAQAEKLSHSNIQNVYF